jgi:hypothetical protein
MALASNFSAKCAGVCVIVVLLLFFGPACKAQDQSQSQAQNAPATGGASQTPSATAAAPASQVPSATGSASPTPAAPSSQTPSAHANPMEAMGTSTDLFFMLGSDFDRPGLLPKANYNIGIGHTFGFLKKDPFGDEITVSYTYEDCGSGFWHSKFGSDTESLGLMKNFGLPKTQRVSGYTMIQAGVTSFTGNSHILNRFYDGEVLGAVVHFDMRNSIWIQEMFNKIPTVPWYTTTSIGYTRSW